jgi:hypothetical protein
MPDWLIPGIFTVLAIGILAVLMTEVDDVVTQARGVSAEEPPPAEEPSPEPDDA